MTSINEQRLQNLLADMVDIYSPSGKEQQLVSYISDYLIQNDLPVTLRPVTAGRQNIEVMLHPEPDVAFLGHVDTVPAFDIEKYDSHIEDGWMHGLGTADMKSGCAAMIEAFITCHENQCLPEKAALFLVVGEEETGDGTSALLQSVKFPSAIVAEPTEFKPCFKHYGYVEMMLQAIGKRRHAAMAGREYNAILNLLQTLLSLTTLIEETHPQAVMNIRSVQSSESGFAVPGSAEAWLDLHMPPKTDLAQLQNQISETVVNCIDETAITDYKLEFPLIANGFEISEDSSLARLCKKSYERLNLNCQTQTFRSHSDANLLIEAGCAPVMLGPGRLSLAHTREEAVELSQVNLAASLYTQILELMTQTAHE